MYSPQPELNDYWTKVAYKRGRSKQEETQIEAEHDKESEYWLNFHFQPLHTSTRRGK
jgi:hypothetical protein